MTYRVSCARAPRWHWGGSLSVFAHFLLEHLFFGSSPSILPKCPDCSSANRGPRSLPLTLVYAIHLQESNGNHSMHIACNLPRHQCTNSPPSPWGGWVLDTEGSAVGGGTVAKAAVTWGGGGVRPGSYTSMDSSFSTTGHWNKSQNGGPSRVQEDNRSRSSCTRCPSKAILGIRPLRGCWFCNSTGIFLDKQRGGLVTEATSYIRDIGSSMHQCWKTLLHNWSILKNTKTQNINYDMLKYIFCVLS